jgi:signal transduction protein with GAF and PtsI domain
MLGARSRESVNGGVQPALDGAAASKIVGELERERPLLELDQRLGRLLDLTLDTLAAEIGSILLVSSDCRMRIVAARGLPSEVVRNTCMEIGEGISGHVARTGEGLLIRNVESDDRFRRQNRERYYTPSCVSAPLLVEGAVRGVMNLSNKRDRTRFGLPELSVAARVAADVARILTPTELGQWCLASLPGVRAGTITRD